MTREAIELKFYQGLNHLGMAEIKLAAMQKELATLTALLQGLRAKMDALPLAFQITRQEGETIFDTLGRKYGLRPDQMQVYVESRAAGLSHEWAERAVKQRQIQ